MLQSLHLRIPPGSLWANYDARASADWRSAEAVAVTTYSSLFNTNPFFSDANVVILDDAHSAENYVSAFWSLLLEKSNPQHEAVFSALLGVIIRLLPSYDKSRLAATDQSDVTDRRRNHSSGYYAMHENYQGRNSYFEKTALLESG